MTSPDADRASHLDVMMDGLTFEPTAPGLPDTAGPARPR
jgi:hypothetical protein